MSDNYDITRQPIYEALIVALIVIVIAGGIIGYDILREKPATEMQVSEFQARTALSMTKRIEKLPMSDERQAYLAFAAEAVNDNILTQSEYRKLEHLSKAADSVASYGAIANYTSEIKALTLNE